MLEIIIILAIIGLIGNLISWLKDHTSDIIGVILLIILIPIALVVLIYGWPFMLIYYFVTNGKSQEYLKWLEARGIGLQSKAPGKERIWKWCSKHGHTEEIGSGLVLSKKFQDRVSELINQQKVVTEGTFEKCCLQAAFGFQTTYTSLFLDYMTAHSFLVPIREYGKNTQYLSNELKNKYEHLLESEGAATEKEFTNICKGISANSGIAIDSRTIARSVLEHMVSQGKVHKVELPDLGEDLFVLTNGKNNSKMRCREISLD